MALRGVVFYVWNEVFLRSPGGPPPCASRPPLPYARGGSRPRPSPTSPPDNPLQKPVRCHHVVSPPNREQSWRRHQSSVKRRGARVRDAPARRRHLHTGLSCSLLNAIRINAVRGSGCGSRAGGGRAMAAAAGEGGPSPGHVAAGARRSSELGTPVRSLSRRSSASVPGRARSASAPSSLLRRLTWSRSNSTSQRPSLGSQWDHRVFGCYSELFAATVGNVEWLRFCMNPDRKEILADDQGFTAIHLAARRGRLPCIQVLVEEYQFPVDLPTDDGRTPLHLVLNKDNKTTAVPCLNYLLQRGADINAVTCNNSTPLHLAAYDGMLKCLEVLVQNGADVHAQDATGCKAIDYCKIWNHRSCARFLKDAMWKQDKKAFACEMKKLKHLKEELMYMEQEYLKKCKKEQSIQMDTDFKKWLHLKKQSQPPISSTTQEASAVLHSFDSKTPGTKGLQHSVEERLQSLLQPKILPKPFSPATIHQRPKLWNVSSNLASSPATNICYPQGYRLGVHPDANQEHDFSSFVEVIQDDHGFVSLHTVDDQWVAPIPELPLNVIVSSLFPKSQPYRMMVPQDLHAISILNLPHRRYVGKDTWIDSVTMNLRETFDEAFLRALQSQVLLASPPQSS
ncbi:ankyrin repeat domain-containing protein 53 [Thomomys bottae]